MIAVLRMDAAELIALCDELSVYPVNFNCPGQIVISGEVEAVDAACVAMKEAGARRALKLPVGGAFHSPLMAPAAEDLKAAILKTQNATCYECAELTKAVSGDHVRFLNGHQTLCHYRVQKHCRLGHFGLFEIIGRAFKHHFRQREAKQPIGCLTHLAGFCMCIVQVFAHARKLASLTRENKCFAHDYITTGSPMTLPNRITTSNAKIA